jgi:hypothetical protein
MTPELLTEFENLLETHPPEHEAIKQFVLAAYTASTGENSRWI